MHLIGEGWGPSVDIPTFSSIYCRHQDATVNASGSVIEGLNMSGLHFGYYSSGTLENVVVKRCNVDYPYYNYSYSNTPISNIRIEDSRIRYYATFSSSYWSGNGGNGAMWRASSFCGACLMVIPVITCLGSAIAMVT